MNNNMFNFFLSYSRDVDKNIIEELVGILESWGFTIWRDKEEVVLGYDIYKGLYDTLNACRSWNGMLAIIDNTYLTKDWCLKELDFAIENDIPIYPILLFLSKSDLPMQYEKLKRLNLCTIKTIADLDYATYKIVNRFLTDYLSKVQFSNMLLPHSILDNLVDSFNHGNRNVEGIIFNCDNIAMCINYLLIDKELCLGHNELILYNLIHDAVREYYISGNISRLQIRIITKATDCLLYKYYYS